MEESIVVREENEKKRRKLKSKVWNDFTKSEPGEDGKQWAICNHCGGKFDGSSKKGTTHLKNHLESKICRDKRKGDDDDANGDKSTKVRDLASTPVVMEEKLSVIDLIEEIFDGDGCPTELWDPSVLNSRKVEILQLYQEEKDKLREVLNKLSCRFTLHIVREDPHLLLIVHYIDDNWERQIKFIGIIPRENYIEVMKESCLDWKIDRKICSIRHDCFIEDEDDKEVIESWFSQPGSLPFAGFVLDFEGFKYEIQDLIDELEMIEIDGLRECVDYVYKKSKELELRRAVHEATTMGKKVIYRHPCNALLYRPFEHLEVAVGLKEAYSELEKIVPDFISINLTKEKWDEAIATFEHLKALKEFSNRFRWYNCASSTTTVVDILESLRCHRNEDCDVCKDASYKKLFDKIKVHLLVVILDPRFKMDTLHRWYEEIYGSDADGYLEKTVKYFRDVYNEYAKDSSDFKMMDLLGRPSTSSRKSELDLYLNDLKVPAVKKFHILAWWRGNARFYPTLARMARDYLAIPNHRTYCDSILGNEIYYITQDCEIDDDIESALIYLRGLW